MARKDIPHGRKLLAFPLPYSASFNSRSGPQGSMYYATVTARGDSEPFAALNMHEWEGPGNAIEAQRQADILCARLTAEYDEAEAKARRGSGADDPTRPGYFYPDPDPAEVAENRRLLEMDRRDALDPDRE